MYSVLQGRKEQREGVRMFELACALHFTSMNYPKAAKLVSQAGFTGFEVSPWLPQRLSTRDVHALKSLLKKYGLLFSGFTSIYPPEMILAANSLAARKRNVRYTEWLIDMAHYLEGRSLVWGSPRSRNIPPGIPAAKGYGRLVELLRLTGAFADRRNVKLAIEPINRFESALFHNVDEALSLAKSVNRKSVGIVYDMYHAIIEEDSLTEPIFRANKRIATVHVADCNRKMPGKGHLEFEAVFNALKKVRYDGFVTVEALPGRDPAHDLTASRKYLERFM